LTFSTGMIGAGVVAFAWVVATAFTLQGVVGAYGTGASVLQPSSLARLAPSQPTGYSGLRLGAINPASNKAVALAAASRSAAAAAAEIAALTPSYSYIGKGDRLLPAMTEVADAGNPASAVAGKSARPLPQNVMEALKLALAVPPARSGDAMAIRTASVDLGQSAASTDLALSTAAPTTPKPSHNERLALGDAAPAAAVDTTAQVGADKVGPSASDRAMQTVMLDPIPNRDGTTSLTPRPQTPARPAHQPPVVATASHQTRPDSSDEGDDSDNGLPSSAAAMVEPDAQRANVAVEQTFGLVMPTASGDNHNASADDMLMSSIPLPTMRPAPSPDAATTPAAKLSRPSKALLAYARPDDTGEDNEPLFKAPSSLPNARTRVAIYDISAARVYLPNGEQLEAHSGMGAMIDNPRYVNQKNRGPTPPHTYDLTLRESLFHGVQALRLNPVDPSALYGRDGLLAHTYMLGRRGDSNGCVVFKDYARFLSAYRRGEVNRLLVVPHLSAAPSRVASR
jgi:hypothetical protein